MPGKTKKTRFIKFEAVKAHINDIHKMRSSDKAVKKLVNRFDETIEAVIKDTQKTTKKDRRNTIMDQDIIPAMEKHLGKKHLSWQETTQEIIRQNPTDLGKISKAINSHIKKERQKK